jgi:hypothetical protein
MEENVGRHPPRHPPNPIQVSKWNTTHLRIENAKQALQILRWLLTKFYRSGKRFTDKEIFALYEISQYFENYRQKGFFESKNRGLYLRLRLLANLSLKPELKTYERAQEKLLLSQRTLMNPREFLGLPPSFLQKFLFVRNRRLDRKPQEPRRIGVGYRDKGATQVTSYDGSPRLSEVIRGTADPFLFREESKEWWEVTHFLI